VPVNSRLRVSGRTEAEALENIREAIAGRVEARAVNDMQLTN
jgi:predicted RNase H-like HicB family nuclease